MKDQTIATDFALKKAEVKREQAQTAEIGVRQMALRANAISNFRAAVSKLIDALNEVAANKRQYDAQALGNPTTGLVDGDFTAGNADLSAADFKAAAVASAELNVAFTSGGTISAGMDAKLYKMKP